MHNVDCIFEIERSTIHAVFCWDTTLALMLEMILQQNKLIVEIKSYTNQSHGMQPLSCRRAEGLALSSTEIPHLSVYIGYIIM